MGLSIKVTPEGKICRKTNGAISLCPGASPYVVVFPPSYPWEPVFEHRYPLTEAGGVWVASGSIVWEGDNQSESFFHMGYFYPINTGQISVAIDYTIEMTIDPDTDVRAVRVQLYVEHAGLSGSSDDTEYFASGEEFTLSYANYPSPRFIWLA